MGSHLNRNRQFMIGSSLSGGMVILIVLISLYIGFKQESNITSKGKELYTITLEKSFIGEEFEIFINDSLLYRGVIDINNLNFKFPSANLKGAILLNNIKINRLQLFNITTHTKRYQFGLDPLKQVIDLGL